MPKYVTSEHYRVDIGAHVFPTEKYELIVERLIQEHGARREDFLEAPRATETEVTSVHTDEYYSKCRDGRLSVYEVLQLELPWSPTLFEAALRCVGGSLLAGRLALEQGAGLHIGGGFHHAFPDHGEGFCIFNDHCCAVRTLQREGLVRRVLVVDCDLHQGNGTAMIFADDPDVLTFSIHQDNIYPGVKPPSTVDIGLDPGTGDREYLDQLQRRLPELFDRARPDLVVYVAGADPYREDQLGSLHLSLEGLRQRDEYVVGLCEEQGAPILLVFAGGYARRVEDTVTIHTTSLLEASRLWRD